MQNSTPLKQSLENTDSPKQDKHNASNKKNTFLIFLIIILFLALTGVVGYTAYNLGKEAGVNTNEDKITETKDSNESNTSDTDSETTQKDEATGYLPEIPSDYNSLNSNTCNLSFALPSQDSYEAEVYDIGKQKDEEYKWVYLESEDVDPEKYNSYLFFKPTDILWLSYTPGGKYGFPCGAGCVQETSVIVYCAEDQRDLDSIWDEMKTEISEHNETLYDASMEYREIKSSDKISKWGFDVLEIETNEILDVPNETFYLFTDGNIKYLVSYYGPEEETVENIFKTFDFSK